MGCRKKTTKNSEEKPKIPGVGSWQQKHETGRRLTSRQKLEVQLRIDKSVNSFTKEVSRQRTEAMHLLQKMIFSAGECLPKTELVLLAQKLLVKFGPSYGIITELVEKMVKAFAEVAPDEDLAAFAKVSHEDANGRDLAVRGISLAQ